MKKNPVLAITQLLVSFVCLALLLLNHVGAIAIPDFWPMLLLVLALIPSIIRDM